MKPTSLEANIGFAYMLIFSNFDMAIQMTNDKSTLLDRSWNNSI
jgi:hypothetical protein